MNPQLMSDEYRRSRGLPAISNEQKAKNLEESKAYYRRRLPQLLEEIQQSDGLLVCPRCRWAWSIFEGRCESCPGNPRGIPMGAGERFLRKEALGRLLKGIYKPSLFAEIDELKEALGFAATYGCRRLLALGKQVARAALGKLGGGA